MSTQADVFVGDFKNSDSIREFSKGCDVLTAEIEHVDADVLQTLQNEGVKIQPSPVIRFFSQSNHETVSPFC